MYEKYFKRLLDIIFSLILMPILLILYIVVGILIKLDDGGPVFYCGRRLGRSGRVFKMYKFRSMKVGAEDIRNEDGSTYSSSDDKRLTRVGKVLRETSIDEFPQLINVLKGDMSFIGPRPDLPEHIKVYDEYERKKLDVYPGITGYNQAYYRNTISWKSRLKNDVYYVENISFLLDLKIFFKTIKEVLNRRGVYSSFSLGNVDKREDGDWCGRGKS